MKRNQLKRIILIIAICTFCRPNFIFGAVVNSTPNLSAGASLRTGLTGWWTFDGKDMLNGAVVDKSGNGNTGNLQNIATSSFYTSGKIGQAFNFDGVDDSVKLTSDPIGTGATTISAWIYPESYGGSARGAIIWSNSTRFRITGIGLLLEFTSNGFTNTAQSSSNSMRQLNKWYHVVVTRDSSNQATIYVNGVLSGTANQASGTPTGSSAGNIGETVSSANRFDGKIDDVRVYNRVLTTSEITKLYNEGNNKVNVTPKDNLKSGLVGWWTMDGEHITWTSSSAGTIRDNSGNGLTGTLTSMNIATSTGAGRVGQGVNFSGISTQITVNDTNALSFGNSTTDSPFTFSAWVKRGVVSKGNAILTKSGITVGITPIEYIFYLRSDNKLGVILYDNNGTNQISLVSNSTFETDVNKWVHYAVSYNGSGLNTGLTLYRNGVAISATVGSAGAYVAMENGANILRIGNAWPNDPTPANRFPMAGTIDDVRIYNRVLSADEMLELYNQGAGDKVNITPKGVASTELNSGLAGWWTFDGKDMLNGAVVDKSGNGNTANLVNISTSTFYTIGKLGQAFKFDGVDDQVKINAASTINNLSAMTISIWAKANGYGGASAGRLFDKGQWTFSITSSSGGAAGLDVTYSGGTNLRRYSAGGTFTLNSWNHWVLTWDGSNSSSGIHIYKNGVETSYAGALDRDGVGSKSSDSASNLFIGNQSAAARSFSGVLDDARIYNRVLSNSEIRKLYNQGR